MKVIIAKNIQDTTMRIELEVGEIIKINCLQELIRDAVSEALDGAGIIFEKFPRFKQITFDTSNDEERRMIAQAYKMRGIADDIKESNS